MYKNNNNRYCKSQSRKRHLLCDAVNYGFCLKQTVANAITVPNNKQNEVPRCLSVP
jgi:hypothetical protein